MGDNDMKRRKSLLLAITTILLLTSCGQPEKKNITIQERAKLAEQSNPKIVEASNRFGLELASELIAKDTGKNVTLSPVSIMQALAMTVNGAAGATREQMSKALHIEGLSEEALNSGQKQLRELLLQPGPDIKLTMANSLWLQKGWPFRKPYLDRVTEAYAAQLHERELAAPAVRKEINDWVKQQTEGLIPTILDEQVSKLTKLMLINALYFDGTWKTPFKPENTKKDDFTNADGSLAQVPFMHQGGNFEYQETDTYQAIRLPYGKGQMGMLLILPQPGTDKGILAKELLAHPDFWTKQMDQMAGMIALPKFKLESHYNLADTMSAMGMALPFDSQQADFSELAETSGVEKLFISQVVHKTVIDVSEQGTEAAAVTQIGMEAGSAEPTQSFEMAINRPFLFAIQDLQSGALLFVGSVETL
jgi:serine protease inhibitor